MRDSLAAARAVILDMDGTLLDSEQIYFSSAVLAVKELGFEDAHEACTTIIGLPGPIADGILRERYGSNFDHAGFRAAFVRHRDRQATAGIALKTGVVELLDALTAAGTPIAVATSSTRINAIHHLERTGIAVRFAAIATRDDVTRTKPAPDVYLVAAGMLGIAPEHCIAIEDSAPGIAAARASGTIPLLVPDLLAPTPEMRAEAAYVLPDLHAVLTLLRETTSLTA